MDSRICLFHRLCTATIWVYSGANLTYGKDKLPALSSIAEVCFGENGDQYLAGIWKRKIEEQLCWGLAGCKALERPLWRAPSWPWASINGHVAWQTICNGALDTRYAHVVDANTSPSGYNSFGQVTDGFIRLACSTIALGHLVSTPNLDGAGYENAAAILLNVRGQKKTLSIYLNCLDDVDQNYTRPIHLVPLLGGKSGTSHSVNEGETIEELKIQGIVLRNTDSAIGTHTRIGYFSFFKDSANIGWSKNITEELYEPFLQALEEQGLATAETACSEILSDAEPSDHRYLITIV
ncbi:hypothetical protein BCON_0246g00210 [Botryotinia convoluta]|uniref:Uncharacterized protein n=1 Tax=Botryotinia convoluta TaxID=54673 RepID=A0A4Z1HLT9_9HELO|nr:hypothetical protein BCON_0246g00210 [Botryotinia convoluta]